MFAARKEWSFISRCRNIYFRSRLYRIKSGIRSCEPVSSLFNFRVDVLFLEMNKKFNIVVPESYPRLVIVGQWLVGIFILRNFRRKYKLYLTMPTRKRLRHDRSGKNIFRMHTLDLNPWTITHFGIVGHGRDTLLRKCPSTSICRKKLLTLFTSQPHFRLLLMLDPLWSWRQNRYINFVSNLNLTTAERTERLIRNTFDIETFKRPKYWNILLLKHRSR